MAQLAADGFDTTFNPLTKGDTNAIAVVRQVLQARHFDCVVIGAGVRSLPKHTVLFEALVNAVVELTPTARLAFNTTPADAAEAVQRWFPKALGITEIV